MEEIEKYESQIESTIDVQRKQIVERITKESDRLIDELLAIIYNESIDGEGRPVVDAKTKLQAITMLIDRTIPKLGIEHPVSEAIEETGSRKKLRVEIENLIQKMKDKDAG